MRPRARRELVVRELGGETLVYDRERHQAHCLNRVAGNVLRHCDGTRSLEEIAALLDEGEHPEVRQGIVRLALEQLSAARLLVAGDEPHGAPALGRDAATASRRDMLRLAALAVPVIVSITAPTPAQAASVCINGSECFGHEGARCDVSDSGDCTSEPPTCCTSLGLCEPTCP